MKGNIRLNQNLSVGNITFDIDDVVADSVNSRQVLEKCFKKKRSTTTASHHREWRANRVISRLEGFEPVASRGGA